MELLNGLAATRFKDWVHSKGISYNPKQWSLDLAESMYYALIIEFFDGVEIYITTRHYDRNWNAFINDSLIDVNLMPWFKSRSEAIKQAIIQSNNLYNLKHSHELFS